MLRNVDEPEEWWDNSLIADAREARRRNPPDYIPLYKGGTVAGLCTFFQPPDDNSVHGLASAGGSDFVFDVYDGGVCFALLRELATYHANHSFRGKKGDRECAVLCVWVDRRDYEKDLVILEEDDRWKKVWCTHHLDETL